MTTFILSLYIMGLHAGYVHSFPTRRSSDLSDLPPVATPFVKWATEARRLEDLPRIVRRAVKTALAQPSGPVFLSLPVDVLNAERDNLDLLAPTRVAPRLVGDRAAIDAAAKRLVAADKPLIVAGCP